MKYIKNRTFALILTVALFFAAVTALFILNAQNAFAQTQEGYYYGQLTEEAKRFYNAIADMQSQGLLKSGNAEYDLISNGVLTDAQCASFSVSSDVTVAYGAARDAYSLDHPEVFYVDFNYLSVSVGVKNGNYVATLGTGRADSYYIEGGFASVGEVEKAISVYENAVAAIVKEAGSLGSQTEMVKYVNSRLIGDITYSFCSYATESGTVYTDGAAHIRNAYGALVNGKAVCEGYARAFKAVMDALGVDCVLVQGYSQGDGSGLEPHMWNYVRIGNGWYGVDVTWNDTAGAAEEYLLRGNSVMKLDHIPDGTISESNYVFDYPALNPYDYGVTTDANGISVEWEYVDGSSEGSKLMYLKVSYAGKSATKLAAEDGLYIAYRYRYEESGSTIWGDWIYYWNDDEADHSETSINSYVQYIQFALIDYAPDLYNSYDGDKLTDRHMGDLGEPIINDAYGVYSAPPYVKSLTPSNQTFIKATQTYEVAVTYTENLKIQDENAAVGVIFSSQHSDITDYAKVENVTWDPSRPDTLTFTFTPSQMFNHRYEMYSFFTVNLVGEESGKQPNSFSLLTEQTSVACSKIYGDGRLYIKSYGQPSLVSSSDLSLTGWTDEEGNYIAENQRSQLMLVVSKPDEGQSGEMLESAVSASGAAQNAVLACETYELELDICSHIVNIPDGSYMQLAFGFPAGYGAEDAGVTFKVYHFKRGENGEIDYSKTEELECVITEYGIIVTVTDFSPFAVVAFDKDGLTAAEKGVYARVVGFGGSIEGKAVATVGEDGSAVYTFVSESGYKVDRALLNGENLEISGNSVVLGYDDLAENNVLTVSFVAERVATAEAAEGITNVYPCVDIKSATNAPEDWSSGIDGSVVSSDEGSWKTGLIAVAVVLAVCVAAGAAVVLVGKKRSRK